jgi:hypothetical protein
MYRFTIQLSAVKVENFLSFKPSFQMVAYADRTHAYGSTRKKQIACLQGEEP